MPEVRFKIEQRTHECLAEEAASVGLEIGQFMRQILRERYSVGETSDSFLYMEQGEPVERMEAWREHCKQHGMPFIAMKVQKAWKQTQWVFMEIDLHSTNIVLTHEMLIDIRMILKDSPNASMRTDTQNKWLNCACQSPYRQKFPDSGGC